MTVAADTLGTWVAVATLAIAVDRLVRRRRRERNEVFGDFPGGSFAVDFELVTSCVPATAPPAVGALVTHYGRCHCGAVRFEAVGPSDVVAYDCNCSNCSMRRNVHFVVPEAQFRLLSGRLSCYRFGTGVARHYFCSRCGITPFYRPRSNPDGVAVSVACVERGSIASLGIKRFDGVNWEQHLHKSGILQFSKAKPQ